jgi:hypothetical protein
MAVVENDAAGRKSGDSRTTFQNSQMMKQGLPIRNASLKLFPHRNQGFQSTGARYSIRSQ